MPTASVVYLSESISSCFIHEEARSKVFLILNKGRENFVAQPPSAVRNNRSVADFFICVDLRSSAAQVFCCSDHARSRRSRRFPTCPSTPPCAFPAMPESPLLRLPFASALPRKSSPPGPALYPDGWNPTHKKLSWHAPAPQGSA